MQTNSARTKASLLSRLADAGMTPSELTSEDYPNVLAALGWKPSTFRTALLYLGKSDEAKKLPEGFRDYVPTQEEAKVIQEHLGAFGRTLVWLGCRWDEMWRLTLDGNTLTVHSQKGSEVLVVNLDEADKVTRSAVKSWVAEAPEVHPKKMRRRWWKLRDAGLISPECVPHAFRHRLITMLLNRGHNIADVAKTIGHRNVQTTYRYHHSSPTKRAQMRNEVKV